MEWAVETILRYGHAWRPRKADQSPLKRRSHKDLRCLGIAASCSSRTFEQFSPVFQLCCQRASDQIPAPPVRCLGAVLLLSSLLWACLLFQSYHPPTHRVPTGEATMPRIIALATPRPVLLTSATPVQAAVTASARKEHNAAVTPPEIIILNNYSNASKTCSELITRSLQLRNS